MEQEKKWNPLTCSRPQQTNKAAAYSLYRAVEEVGWTGSDDGSMAEEWEKLWRDQIGRNVFLSLSASLSSFLSFPLSAIRLLPAEGWRRPSSTPIHVFFVWERKPRGVVGVGKQGGREGASPSHPRVFTRWARVRMCAFMVTEAETPNSVLYSSAQQYSLRVFLSGGGYASRCTCRQPRLIRANMENCS